MADIGKILSGSEQDTRDWSAPHSAGNAVLDEKGNPLAAPYRVIVSVDTDGNGNPAVDADGTISINDIKVVAA